MMIFTYRPRVSPAQFKSCWWHHNWLLMMSQRPDNCNVSTWKVISNSLNVDFIHSDIHCRLGKKTVPNSKVHGANMGPNWVLSAPDGLHVVPMNLVIRAILQCYFTATGAITWQRNHNKIKLYTNHVHVLRDKVCPKHVHCYTKYFFICDSNAREIFLGKYPSSQPVNYPQKCQWFKALKFPFLLT